MDLQEIKSYLEEKLPKFTFITNNNKGNEKSIWIERDGQHMIIDISRIQTKKQLKDFKDYIKGQWKLYKNMVEKQQ